MNELRREKLKHLIMKLPLGSQLLQLRRRIISWRKEKKRIKIKQHNKKLQLKIVQKNQKHCEKILKQKEKELFKDKQLNGNCVRQSGKQLQFIEKSKVELLQKKEALRHCEITTDWKNILFFNARLRNISYYYTRSVGNVNRFKSYSQLPPEQVTVFEIGTGPSVVAPIGMSLLGFKKIVTVDIKRAKPKFVQLVYQHYHKYAKKLGIKHVPKIKEKITKENLDRILLQNFNIDYRAPYDAAHTDLPDESVGYVYANLVFNFIRAELLPDIMKEAFRILQKGGVMYIQIIYKDHGTILDSKLTVYDFLQYTNEEWKLRDPIAHQNRLRTPDYLSMFTAAGFEIIKYKRKEDTDADRAEFGKVKVADEFKKKYTEEELMEREAEFVLRKP